MSVKLENVVLASPEQMEFIIEGMRNPMNSWEKSDSSCGKVTRVTNVQWSDDYFIGTNDTNLMQRLSNAGTEHRKYMRMMPVYVRITAPLYWWKEFDTYKVGTVANSCSTMHKIAAKEFALEDFSTEHLTEESFSVIEDVIIKLNDYRAKYIKQSSYRKSVEHSNNSGHISGRSGRYPMFGISEKDIWWQMIQLLPSSYNQTRNVMMNYEVLANIYRQRKNHKLDEWREVCKWIESLPYNELITVDSREVIKEELRKEIMKASKFPAPWEAHGTAEYAKIHPDQLITIAEMEADARRAIPADEIKTGIMETADRRDSKEE